MSNGAEREWLVFLVGPAGTISVVVKSDSGPEIGNNEVRLGESRILREMFAGAFPKDKVSKANVYPGSPD